MRTPILLAALLLAMTGCKKKDEATAAPPPSATGAAASHRGGPADGDGGHLRINLAIETTSTSTTFDRPELSVPAGSEVHLVLRNSVGTGTLSPLSHNWVLVKPSAASDAGSAAPEIIAQTAIVPPGASKAVTFTAPPAGIYEYICTVPGHPGRMSGVLKSIE